MNYTCDISVIIVSYNACDYLRRCLRDVEAASDGLKIETFVVDNLSSDGSCEMVVKEFPGVKLIRCSANLGFSAANNLAIRQAGGRYYLLLNSDAFVAHDALRNAVEQMDARPNAGAATAYMTFEDGSYQISARFFSTLHSIFFSLSGLSAHHPQSKFFSYTDRTWDDPNKPAKVGWVSGAFMILRASAIEKVGLLDEELFFYYEDVDICERMHKAGFEVWYLPAIRVVHIGGGSASSADKPFSQDGSQIIQWRMRSMLLYYRKHNPAMTWMVAVLEHTWYWLRAVHNRDSKEAHGPERHERFTHMTRLLKQAWRETRGGKYSPPRPW